MGKLIAVVGASGVGKTALARALAKAADFAVAYEQHEERPFQRLLLQDRRYALANQIDYLLYRAEQERELRASPRIGLVDGGLDLDFHGFTRLFHSRGLLDDAEYDLCRRFYELARRLLPLPELIIHLEATEETVRQRLAGRQRINIASAEDTALFNAFLEQWLGSMKAAGILHLDVSGDDIQYTRSLPLILQKISGWDE